MGQYFFAFATSILALPIVFAGPEARGNSFAAPKIAVATAADAPAKLSATFSNPTTRTEFNAVLVRLKCADANGSTRDFDVLFAPASFNAASRGQALEHADIRVAFAPALGPGEARTITFEVPLNTKTQAVRCERASVRGAW